MGIEALLARIDAMLPAAMTDRVILPQSPDAMEVVSWIYDHADVETAEHTPESIAVTYRADRVTVARTRAKLTQLGDAEQVLEG